MTDQGLRIYLMADGRVVYAKHKPLSLLYNSTLAIEVVGDKVEIIKDQRSHRQIVAAKPHLGPVPLATGWVFESTGPKRLSPERELEIRSALAETPMKDRDPADHAIQELFDELDRVREVSEPDATALTLSAGERTVEWWESTGNCFFCAAQAEPRAGESSQHDVDCEVGKIIAMRKSGG